MTQSDDLSGFKLTGTDGIDSASYRLSHVSTGVDRNNDETTCQCAPLDPQIRQTVVDNHRLYDHWCTSKHFHIYADDCFYYFYQTTLCIIAICFQFNGLNDTNDKSDDTSYNSTGHCQSKCPACAFQKDAFIFHDEVSNPVPKGTIYGKGCRLCNKHCHSMSPISAPLWYPLFAAKRRLGTNLGIIQNHLPADLRWLPPSSYLSLHRKCLSMSYCRHQRQPNRLFLLRPRYL